MQRGSQIDLADPRLGLRRRDPQAARVEIHVPPAQIKRLADPQPRQRQSGEQRTAAASVALSRVGVDLPGLREVTEGRIDPEQAWFWTREWQQREREADKDLTAGRVTRFESDEEFLAELGERTKPLDADA